MEENNTAILETNCRLYQSVAFDKASNRIEDKGTGILKVKNNPITAEEVVEYYVARDRKGNEIFPIKLAQAAGKKYGEKVKVYRPWSEIEKAKDSFSLMPITVGHHDYSVYKKSKVPEVGSMGSSFAEDEIKGKKALLLDCKFDDPKTIQAVKDGKLEDFSIGYDLKYQYNPGVFVDKQGVKHEYDFIQKDIVCNHVALIPPNTGRCDIAGVADHNEDQDALFFDNFYFIGGDEPMSNANDEKTGMSLEKVDNELLNAAKGKDEDNMSAEDSKKKMEEEAAKKKSAEDGKVAFEPEKGKKEGDEEAAKKKAKDQDVYYHGKTKSADQLIEELQQQRASDQKEMAEMKEKLKAIEARDVQKAQDAKDYEEKLELFNHIKQSQMAYACDSLEEAATAFDSFIDVLHSNGKIGIDASKMSMHDKSMFMLGYNAKKVNFDFTKMIKAKATDAKQEPDVKTEIVDGKAVEVRNFYKHAL